jgi:hypothetical protein
VCTDGVGRKLVVNNDVLLQILIILSRLTVIK